MATASLVATGCVMLRKCHLNTCSVGIATQDPALRAKFTGKPEDVVTYFTFVAEGVRARTSRGSVRARSTRSSAASSTCARGAREHPEGAAARSRRRSSRRRSRRDRRLPRRFARAAAVGSRRSRRSRAARRADARSPAAADRARAADRQQQARRRARCCPARSRGGTARAACPTARSRVRFTGSRRPELRRVPRAGRHARARGRRERLHRQGHVGRAHHRASRRPARAFAPEDNVIVGNVALYGATAGDLFANGLGGERFAVRNSGARAVVEGVGDHGCEYMTGGVVVVLGPVGRNFAAGMSGGTAFVFDPAQALRARTQPRDGRARAARRRERRCGSSAGLSTITCGSRGSPLRAAAARQLGAPGRAVREGDADRVQARAARAAPARHERRAAAAPPRRERPLMGKPTGFLEWTRAVAATKRRSPSACATGARSTAGRGSRGDAAPGRPLHGLRRAVLHAGLPARQPDPRLRRRRVTTRAEAGTPARSRELAGDERLPRVHRRGSAPRRRAKRALRAAPSTERAR